MVWKLKKIYLWTEAVCKLLEQLLHRIHEGNWIQTEYIRPLCVCEIMTRALNTYCLDGWSDSDNGVNWKHELTSKRLSRSAIRWQTSPISCAIIWSKTKPCFSSSDALHWSLQKHGMDNPNPIATPVGANVKLKRSDGVSKPVHQQTY